MRVLALDTATAAIALGIAGDGGVVAEERLPPAKGPGHGAGLLARIEAFLARSRIPLDEVDGFAAGAGPGSFTGLRTGLATVQGLAVATGRPAVAVPTLQAIAWGAAGGVPAAGGTVCAMLDARRGEVYWALFRVVPREARPPEALGPEAVGSPSTVVEALRPAGTIHFAGEGAIRYREVISRLRPEGCEFAPPEAAFPTGGAVARLGWTALARRPAGAPLVDLSPRYVRPPDAVAWTGIAQGPEAGDQG